MRVIGIDPGYDRLGIAVIDNGGGKEELVFSECFETNRADTMAKRLFDVGKRLEEVIELHSPDTLAVEELFFYKNQKTAIDVAQVLGIVTYCGMSSGIQVTLYKPQEVKIAVTGYGRSNKKDIIHMVERLIKIPARKMIDDEYDAIAVALTHLASSRYQNITSRSQ